jgi:hypothetical protein
MWQRAQITPNLRRHAHSAHAGSRTQLSRGNVPGNSSGERRHAPASACARKVLRFQRRSALISGGMPLRSKRSRVRVAPGPLRKHQTPSLLNQWRGLVFPDGRSGHRRDQVQIDYTALTALTCRTPIYLLDSDRRSSAGAPSSTKSPGTRISLINSSSTSVSVW